MATTPQKNPRSSADYEAMLEEAVQWAQHKKYDRKILAPALQRVPEANDIRADRLFWVGEVIEAIDVMAHNDNAVDASYRARLQRVNDSDWWKMTGQRTGRARALERQVQDDRFIRAVSGHDTDPEPTRAHHSIRQRVHLKRVRREYEAGDQARAREIERDFEENPPWVTRLLAESMVSLQEQVPAQWMPKLASSQPGRGDHFVGRIAEYGCGAYGCVMPTLNKDIVLKLSSDASEAKFASDLADTLPTPCVVRYHMIVKLEGAERHGREVFLLWRESANDVGKIHEVVGKHAEKAIRKQHRAAVDAYLVLAGGGEVDEYLEKLELWKRRCMEMAKVPELEYVAMGMLRAWNERGIFISDTHGGNLGVCIRNGQPTWVITDPGNVVVVSTSHADERSARTKNPPKKRCDRDHEALKRDDAQWESLEPKGRMVGYDDDGEPIWLELRNCTCKSLLARPEKTDERPPRDLTDNPKRHKPSGELKPLWMYIRQRLRRRHPDFIDALARLPDGREVEVEIVDIDADNTHVTALGTVRYRVPIADIWISGTKDWGTLATEDDDAPVPNPRVPAFGAMRFFEEFAGASYPAGMRQRDGRAYSARELAIAEYVLEDEHPDAEVRWEPDPDAWSGEDVDPDAEYYWAGLFEGDAKRPLASLGGIDNPDSNYRRVIEAELAMEAWPDRVNELTQQLHARRGRPLRIKATRS